MQSVMVAINVVLPLCVLILVGYFSKELKLVSKDAFKQMNQLVFKLLIPASLMKSIMETELSVAFQPKLLFFAIGSILFLCGTLWLIIPYFEKDKRRIGVIIQAIYRSNFVLFGLPIAANMYGAENVAVTSVLIAFCVPLFNVLAVIVLQYYGMEHVDFKAVVKGIITNPMLIGTFIGFFVLLSGIQLPEFAMKSIGDLSKIATPLALIILGGTFEFQSVSKNIKPLSWIVVFKLIVIPAIFVFIGVLMGYRNVELISILVMFGSPVAVSSYAMALAMNGDGELASQAVLITTVISIITMLLWISGLNAFSLI